MLILNDNLILIIARKMKINETILKILKMLNNILKINKCILLIFYNCNRMYRYT